MRKERCAVLRQLTDQSCDVRRELHPRRPVPRAATSLNRGNGESTDDDAGREHRTSVGRLTEADCRLEDLVEVLAERTDRADYPHAAAVVDEVLVYDADRLRAAWPTAPPRGGRRAGPGPDRRARGRGVPRRVPRPRGRRPGHRGVRRADRRAARRRRGRRRPLRHARRQRPGVERAGEARGARAGGVRRLLRQRHAGAGRDGLARPRLPGDLAGQRGQPGRRGADRAPRLPPGVPVQRGIARYPAHVHRLSPVLTLQGAVAHSDMPVESGPTLYLPHSQKYEPGYLAGAGRSSRAYFDAHHVQLPLQPGDAAFFNPALFHGAGTNRSADIRRMANLLQVSSAFGRAMETSTGTGCAARSTPRCAPPPRPAPTSSTRSPRPPRATRSPPTSTATRRSTGWPRPPRPTSYGGRWRRAGTPRARRAELAAHSARRRQQLMRLLDDKVVLVSGGTQGVGAAVARAAVRGGATVAVTGRRPEPGEALVAELRGARRPRRCSSPADLADVGAGAGLASPRWSRRTAGSTAWSTRPG